MRRILALLLLSATPVPAVKVTLAGAASITTIAVNLLEIKTTVAKVKHVAKKARDATRKVFKKATK